ncbi:MAG: heme lyase CcmF/NrfE family subunit, partial [Alphaproteobacteria bacterium]|nr:heme lyase CcmF/NrfE family subunit [Alphaproteobacteria bacterium]
YLRARQILATGQGLVITIAFGLLLHAFAISDFSFLVVFKNSHQDMPYIYKLTALWGNHEGSMLLWVLLLSLMGMLFSWRKAPSTRMLSQALAVLGGINGGFIAYVLFSSNPFLTLAVTPRMGLDLNPLLQDPGLVIHPPFLYMGYVGFVIPFACACAALFQKEIATKWVSWIKPWTLWSWASLTTGITLGSYWAYYELGWGGFWFWDPIENASLMPWLSGTALLHSLLVLEKRRSLKGWCIFLALLTFSLCLLGSLLTRSGVVSSVHAFALDPSRGYFILALLTIIAGSAFSLFAIRRKKIRESSTIKAFSRDTALISNNVLLMTALGAVLLGTIYPIFQEAITGEAVTVGPVYFNKIFLILTLFLGFAMVVGPRIPWQSVSLKKSFDRLGILGLATLAAFTFFYYWLHKSLSISLLLATAFWLLFGTIGLWIRKTQATRLKKLSKTFNLMTMAHLGFTITLIGISVDAGFHKEELSAQYEASGFYFAGYAFNFNGFETIEEPTFTSRKAEIEIHTGFDHLGNVYPERRFYTISQTATSEVALYTIWLSQIYVTLGNELPDGKWNIYVAYRPWILLIWIGGLLMALSGFLGVIPFRARKKKDPLKNKTRS